MKKVNLNRISKYFLYTLLVVGVFLGTYGIGAVVDDDLNWIVNNYVNSTRQNGLLIILFILTSVLSGFVASLIDEG